jgi:hypothetical protein
MCLQLAKDPVAAADFFDFSISCLLEYLLGWNSESGKSKKQGGILGHLKAYYGTAEYTERGSLHGHFIIWLDGGVNPKILHERMKRDNDFETHFFEFFENINHHHLPDIGVDIDKNFEPHTQWPPCPTQLTENSELPLEWIDDWNEIFVSEIKACGEVLQRHECRAVCHKYGNKDHCKFLFPHEIIDTSYFDPETSSIVLMCHDENVNYFNPYILVFF